MGNRPENEPAAFVAAALLIALALAAVGTWVADWKISARSDEEQRSRDVVAAERHDELLQLLAKQPTARRKLRLRDVVLLAIAARVLRG